MPHTVYEPTLAHTHTHTHTHRSYDNPASLHNQLQTWMSSSSTSVPFETDFSLLYTVYSIPNMVLPFFGGFFVDKLGAPLCMAVFASLILAGQTLFAFGSSVQSWPLMLCGRVLFGLGGENLTVAQSALLAEWFKGKELALAFGINLSISRLGSVINNYVSPAVAKHSVPLALWLGMVICAGSLLCALLVWPVDRNAAAKASSKMPDADLTASLLENAEGGNKRVKSSSFDAYSKGTRVISTERMSSSALRLTDISTATDSEQISLSDAKKFGAMFWLLTFSCLVVYGCVLPFNNIAAGILSERNYFKVPDSDCVLTYPDQCSSGSLTNTTNDATAVCTTTSSSYAPTLPSSLSYPEGSLPEGNGFDKTSYVFDKVTADDVDCNDKFWSSGCTKDYCSESDDASTQAAHVMSIPYFISAGMSPFLGLIVDKVGNRAIMATFAPIMLIGVHSTLGFSDGSPVLPLIAQGLAYSLFAAVLWPSVPLTVEEKSVGTAYGLITAIQNAGLAGFPILISTLYNASGEQYLPNVEIFFVVCACGGLLVGLALNVMDGRRGGLLNARDVEGKRAENERREAEGRMPDGPPTPLMST